MCSKHLANKTADAIDSTNFEAHYLHKAPEIKKKPVRTRLWQLDYNYHCAVIGTCLTLTEVKKLLHSLRIKSDQSTAYDIHTAIVTLISYNDFRSKKIQSYLDKKFSALIQKTKKMDTQSLRAEWKRVINTGDLVGTFWAVMSHPLTDEKMKRDFYGDIHMLSHLSGASNRVDLKRLNLLEKERLQLTRDSSFEQTKNYRLKIENLQHISSIKEQKETATHLNFQLSALQDKHTKLLQSNAEKQNRLLVTQINKLNSQLTAMSNERLRLQENSGHLTKSVLELKNKQLSNESEIAIYKEESEFLQTLLDREKNRGDCQFKKQSLCGQCVLYVGGKKNLIPHYRDLIEEKSGVFIYHDGGDEKNTQDLSSSLTRADIVIFPSSCISHDAYWKIKSACKKQQKPFEYLSSPGLCSLSSALEKMGDVSLDL